MLSRPFRQTSITDREAIERALDGLPALPDDPMDCLAVRMSDDEWMAFQADLRRAFPAEWTLSEKLQQSFADAWLAAQAAYERGDIEETIKMVIWTAIYEARWGGRSSAPMELIGLAVLYRIASCGSNKPDFS